MVAGIAFGDFVPKGGNGSVLPMPGGVMERGTMPLELPNDKYPVYFSKVLRAALTAMSNSGSICRAT